MTRVSDSDVGRACRLLLRDIEATLGPGYESVVHDNATRARGFVADPARYVEKVVKDVQQYFHDCHVHTTWPACPHHPNHPLWLHDESWRCERDGVVVAKLGELGRRVQT